MNKNLSIPSYFALIFLLALASGCKIQITVPEGGNVVSASHRYDCDSGNTCVVEVNDFNFADKFDAQAWEGWVFFGWKEGHGYLCQFNESICNLSNKGLEQNKAISAFVESDETLFLEPEFVKGTPLDEALAKVADEELRNCLSKVPAPKKYAEQVRDVDCYSSYEIGSVQGIEAFVRIERLALNGSSSLTNLEPLGKLSRLQDLKLMLRTSYFSAAALSELEQLDYLSLSFFPAGSYNPDLTEMANLQNLRGLRLLALGYLDLHAIGSLVNLRELQTMYGHISDIGPLAGMTRLETLYLGSNQISDISPLAGMTKLKFLDLSSNQITDINPLAPMNRLETLSLGSNQISDISPLAGMTNVTRLSLDHNQIIDISPLAGMIRLETLHVGFNQISDIGALAEIDSIHDLGLSDNLIQDISPLKDHYPLILNSNFNVSLDLSNNPITTTGNALDGIRTGVIELANVPLSCEEYSWLAELYDSRWILTQDLFWYYYNGLDPSLYLPPERCL